MASTMDMAQVYAVLMDGKSATLQFDSEDLAKTFRTSFLRFKRRQDHMFESVDLQTEAQRKRVNFSCTDKDYHIYEISLTDRPVAGFVILEAIPELVTSG